MSRKEEEGSSDHASKWLDWLDFKKIILHNKQTLMRVYAVIKLPNVGLEFGNSNAQKLKWFDKVNTEVRQKVAHSSKGKIRKKGYEMIYEVSEVIKKNIDDDRSQWS